MTYKDSIIDQYRTNVSRYRALLKTGNCKNFEILDRTRSKIHIYKLYSLIKHIENSKIFTESPQLKTRVPEPSFNSQPREKTIHQFIHEERLVLSPEDEYILRLFYYEFSKCELRLNKFDIDLEVFERLLKTLDNKKGIYAYYKDVVLSIIQSFKHESHAYIGQVTKNDLKNNFTKKFAKFQIDRLFYLIEKYPTELTLSTKCLNKIKETGKIGCNAFYTAINFIEKYRGVK